MNRRIARKIYKSSMRLLEVHTILEDLRWHAKSASEFFGAVSRALSTKDIGEDVIVEVPLNLPTVEEIKQASEAQLWRRLDEHFPSVRRTNRIKGLKHSSKQMTAAFRKIPSEARVAWKTADAEYRALRNMPNVTFNLENVEAALGLSGMLHEYIKQQRNPQEQQEAP